MEERWGLLTLDGHPEPILRGASCQRPHGTRHWRSLGIRRCRLHQPNLENHQPFERVEIPE
jgi:hypothetical protein